MHRSGKKIVPAINKLRCDTCGKATSVFRIETVIDSKKIFICPKCAMDIAYELLTAMPEGPRNKVIQAVQPKPTKAEILEKARAAKKEKADARAS